MINSAEVFRKMPMAMLYAKCELLGNGAFKMNIELVSDETSSILNIGSEDIKDKDFFEVLPDLKNDIRFNSTVLATDNRNLTYTKYIKKLMNFIKITIQKVSDTYFLFYLESCIEKSFLEKIKRKDKVFL